MLLRHSLNLWILFISGLQALGADIPLRHLPATSDPSLPSSQWEMRAGRVSVNSIRRSALSASVIKFERLGCSAKFVLAFLTSNSMIFLHCNSEGMPFYTLCALLCFKFDFITTSILTSKTTPECAKFKLIIIYYCHPPFLILKRSHSESLN